MGGLVGIASEWSEAYGIVDGKQYSGWSFDSEEDRFEIGTIMSFIGTSGTPTIITEEIPYFKPTLQLMPLEDGDYRPTNINFMYASWQDRGKIEAR